MVAEICAGNSFVPDIHFTLNSFSEPVIPNAKRNSSIEGNSGFYAVNPGGSTGYERRPSIRFKHQSRFAAEVMPEGVSEINGLGTKTRTRA